MTAVIELANRIAQTNASVLATPYDEKDRFMEGKWRVQVWPNTGAPLKTIVEATRDTLEQALLALGVELTTGWVVTPYLISSNGIYTPKAGA
jgi:hypothetical protein